MYILSTELLVQTVVEVWRKLEGDDHRHTWPKLRKSNAVLMTQKLITLTLRRLRRVVSTPMGVAAAVDSTGESTGGGGTGER